MARSGSGRSSGASTPARASSGVGRASVHAAGPADRPISAELSAALDTLVTDWGAILALAAFACWVLAHVPALAPLMTLAWVVVGLAVGILRPWYGLLLTVMTVPFTGAATDVQSGEILRAIPVHAAAVRVLVDRFIIAPSYGRRTPRDPAWWVVAAAVAAAGLFALAALTAYLAESRDPLVLTGGLVWQVGGPIAMMSAWIAASHLVAGRSRPLTLVVLGTTVVACLLALAAWTGLPGAGMFTFTPIVEGGRLGALGYPTPTAMGLATVLPLAAVAAWRIRWWLVIPVVGLVLVTLVLTWSRGPLLAVVVGTVLAALASGRVDRRLAIAGAAAGAVALAGLVAIRYGTNVDAIIATIGASTGSDSDRIRSWIAAVAIAASNPLFGAGWASLARIPEFAALRIANAHDLLLDAFAAGGLPLGISLSIVVLYSGWRTWVRRHTMAPYLIAAVVTFLVCSVWDIPQVRAYAAVMGGMVLGMAAGPLIGRSPDEDTEGDEAGGRDGDGAGA